MNTARNDAHRTQTQRPNNNRDDDDDDEQTIHSYDCDLQGMREPCVAQRR